MSRTVPAGGCGGTVSQSAKLDPKCNADVPTMFDARIGIAAR
jgi:hypothetical protein